MTPGGSVAFSEMVCDLPPAQSGPSAWTGAQLLDDQSWVWQLGGQEVEQILTGRPGRDLITKVHEMQRELTHGRGFELVRGLPVQQLTPAEAGRVFSSFGRLIGTARSQN
ncbi:MAG: hypothetical protein KJN63_01695, partial [Acidimicrobiia bacterium]|nr:hypothetical protein [Acidimicrobiia bacterium]